jgi:nucleotide-binding universal stress UspA family protein
VAAHLARRLGEPLTLLHVIELPAATALETVQPDAFVTRTFSEAAGRQLARAREAVGGEGLDVRTETEVGALDEQVGAAVQRLGPRLLVLGTHGRRGAARLLLGSFAERMVRASRCPALVVPSSGPLGILEWDPQARPLKMLAGIDMSPATDAAVAWLRTLRVDVPVDISFVHAFHIEREHARLGLEWPADPFEPDPEVLEVLERELRPRIAALPGKGESTLRLRPTWGRDVGPLELEIDLDPPDLVVVGTNQRKRWGRSTAVELLRSGRAPVVSVPAAAAGDRVRPPSGAGPVRRVLVATDFSPLGNSALPVGYRLIATAGGVLDLVHVLSPSEAGTFGEGREAVEKRLRSILREIPPPPGVLARAQVLVDRDAADALVKAVHRLDADLVVLASHGRGGVGRALIGSIAERVMRHSPRPVVVARG